MTKKVKVALCVTNDLTYDQRVLRTASALKELDLDVVLIGRNWPKGSHPNLDGFKTKRFKCWWNQGPLFYLEFNIRLFLLLLFRKFDIQVANDADTLWAVATSSALRSRKWVYDSHEWFTEVPELLGKPVKRRIWHYLQKWLVPKADFRTTVGPMLAVRLSNLFRTPFESIRNLPSFRQVESKTEKGNVILYQGALNVGRGLEEMIGSMVGLPNWNLWLVGSGDIESELKMQIADLGLSDRVILYGRVTPEILRDMTLKAKIGINLLKGESKNYYFSLANKFFDYVNAGVPAISMNFPEYRNLFEDHITGVLVDKCTEDEIIAAVRALEAPEFYQQTVESCLMAAKEWNWDNERLKLQELYRPLLQN